MNREPLDLVVLTPDKNVEASVRGILSRPEALGIRAVQSEVYVHPERDPGCYLRGHEFLRPMLGRYGHALIMFDREGSGAEDRTRAQLESRVEQNMSASGSLFTAWNGRRPSALETAAAWWPRTTIIESHTGATASKAATTTGWAPSAVCHDSSCFVLPIRRPRPAASRTPIMTGAPCCNRCCIWP